MAAVAAVWQRHSTTVVVVAAEQYLHRCTAGEQAVQIRAGLTAAVRGAVLLAAMEAVVVAGLLAQPVRQA